MIIKRYRICRESGLTLIELLVTIAIIAILAGIALPSYTSYIAKTQAKAAQIDILGLGLQLESTYQRTMSYPSVNLGSAANIHISFAGWSPSEVSFTYTLKSDSSGYVISATGTMGANNGCVITMTDSNVRTSNCAGSSGNWL